MSQQPIGANYTYPLGKVAITASQVNTRITVSLGGRFQQNAWIEVSNESPYILSIFSLQGILLNQIQPQICDIAQIPSGDSAFIIVPSLLLPQAAPSSEVDINVYPFGKPTGAYPFPLNRQSAPTSAANTGVGFILARAFNSVVTAGQAVGINIFNPTNSGKNLLLYLARVVMSVAFTVAGNTVSYQFGFNPSGSNTSLNGGALTPIANNTTATSAALGSFTNNQGIGVPDLWEQINFGPSSTVRIDNPVYDFIPFPDQRLIPPGTNAIILVTPTQGVACVGGISFRYTEQ